MTPRNPQPDPEALQIILELQRMVRKVYDAFAICGINADIVI